MSADGRGLSASELRRSFDESFHEPLVSELESEEQLLAIRAGAFNLAIRVAETNGVLRSPRISALPHPRPALLGIGAVRASLYVAYHIAALLGEPAAASEPAWLLLCGPGGSCGLAFDELHGCARVRSDDFRPADHLRVAAVVENVVRIGGETRLVLEVPALLGAIRKRNAGPNRDKE